MVREPIVKRVIFKPGSFLNYEKVKYSRSTRFDQNMSYNEAIINWSQTSKILIDYVPILGSTGAILSQVCKNTYLAGNV